MKGLLAAFALVLLALPVGAFHEGHRHWSTIPDGAHAVLPGQLRTFTASDGTLITYGVHMPDVPAGSRVPVILTAGPYFWLSEEPVHLPSNFRLSGFLIDNFVSHGYAVVAANVRGTGRSGGCMELMSEREARDIDELVTHLAGEPWSTGAVGLIGKSYDGGVAWEVARFGNPALKTIVPIAGVSDMGELLVLRGAPQWRTPIFHSVVYWPYGFGADPLGANAATTRPADQRLANAMCPELALSQTAAIYSTYTGDRTMAPVVADYWAERAWREGTIANYKGSIFIVHGLQDWNVIPSQVVPLFDALPQEKKLLLGQWGHHYPDEGAATNRADFAAILKTWFDRHLKGLPVSTGPVAQVADAATGAWRSVATWPEPPVATRAWRLSAGNTLVEGGEAEPFQVTMASPGGLTVHSRPCNFGAGPTRFLTTLGTGFKLSGLGEMSVRLDPPALGVVVVSVCANSTLVAHGAASTLYPNGNEMEPFAPDRPLDMVIDLEPAERTVPAGARLAVAVRFEDFFGGETGMGYWPGTSPGVGVLTAGELRLPLR